MPPIKNQVDALDVYMDRREAKKRNAAQGTVVSVNGPIATIRLRGSSSTQSAKISEGVKVQPGDTCHLQAVANDARIRWTIISVTGTRDSSASGIAQSPYGALHPPGNFRQGPALAGNVSAAWDAPVSTGFAVEVEQSVTGLDVDALPALTTRGVYAIISTETPLYLRARTVAPDGQYSAYTPWLLLTPTENTSAADPFENVVTWCGQPIFYNGRPLTHGSPA